ncbi:hypothetical protein EVAR_98096_1 [Eumeta japonica]|uniref:Uncharacterized protein n=1 Tax=Eumeta variegata TaxID=151549 RepID=A0A4C1XI68_EUMVA|nr:hypothetical protein EVAR_98096_1 [Eumeta japonica]
MHIHAKFQRNQKPAILNHAFDFTRVLDSRAVHNFGSGLAFDSNPKSLLNPPHRAAFNSNSAHDSDPTPHP